METGDDFVLSYHYFWTSKGTNGWIILILFFVLNMAHCRQYSQESSNLSGTLLSDNFKDWACFCTCKVTRGCREPICRSLGVSQCHLEPSWTPWQSGVVQDNSSSSCGQEPLTPRQTEGNEKRVQQPMVLYFICWETWLILQLWHCLWMQTIKLRNVGQEKEAPWWGCGCERRGLNFVLSGLRRCDASELQACV